ncbi:MAG: hypothetical protein HYX71_08350 [Opitutae bacterium]|nr:hypothetical protein [Opitutae bacterium]
MRRERLKDQIEDPRVSAFDTIVRAVVVLISMAAVFYALAGRGLPAGSKPKPTPNVSAEPAASQVTLTATRNHCFYWNKEGPISVEDFGQRLTTWLKTVKDPRVVVTADETALLADAMALYHESRRQRVAHVQLEVRIHPTP